MIQDGKLRGLPWARPLRCGRTTPPAKFAVLPSERHDPFADLSDAELEMMEQFLAASRARLIRKIQ
jgi:hypothetical protein